jgi:anti-sigma factor RsiW
MNCEQAKTLIDLYADGELDPTAMLELEQHFKSCAACARALNNLQSLKKAVKQDALFFAAPSGLRQRIKAELPSPSKPVQQRPVWNWNWLTTAMAGAAAVCLALLLAVAHPPKVQQLAQEIVSSHIRSLMANHAVDVASTDQHTVKPWFNGKLDFSPPVKDLAAEGFPLDGGRLDYINGRSVAALVFLRQKHIINLFIWPSEEAKAEPVALASNQGYHAVHWADAGMVFWAVSDLNEKELMEFTHTFNATMLSKP